MVKNSVKNQCMSDEELTYFLKIVTNRSNSFYLASLAVYVLNCFVPN